MLASRGAVNIWEADGEHEGVQSRPAGERQTHVAHHVTIKRRKDPILIQPAKTKVPKKAGRSVGELD